MFSPRYIITNKILNNLNEISEIKSLLENTQLLPQDAAMLKRQARIRMVYASVSIEGNPLNKLEVQKILEGQRVEAPKRALLEVQNYQSALNFISQSAKAGKELNLPMVLKVQSLITRGCLAEEKCGKFRPGDVYVANIDRKKEEIVYEAPKKELVSSLLEELINWTKISEKEKLSPVIEAGLFHYQFATIHPFSDGNGRTARSLAAFILYKRGYNFSKLFALDDYYLEHRKEYYLALQTGKTYQRRKNADLTKWLEFFSEGFVFEMRNVKEKLTSLSLTPKLKGAQERVYLNSEEVRIVDFLTSMGKITSDDVTDITKSAKRTAQNYLKSLVEKKVIRSQGKGPSTFYILNT